MRSLVILGPGMSIDTELIANALKDEVKINSYPKAEGLAVFDCGKEPDWAWPDNVIVVGQCELGRHHFDLQIAKTEDATSRIIETLSVLEESEVPEEESGNAE